MGRGAPIGGLPCWHGAPVPRVELRTYHATAGKLDELLARFRDHTLALFDRHGFEVIGFWTGVDAEGDVDGTLVYLLAFADRAGARTGLGGI